MNFRIKILVALIPLCLFLCFISNTYSRYVADTTGNLKMSFAKWQILVNNEDITSNTSTSFDLTPIINENAHVKSNKIAPSSSGYFDIDIDPSNVDVSFNYNITLDVLNENIPDLIITKYAILNSDNNNKSENITYQNIENNIIEGSLEVENIATDNDEIESTNFEPFTIRICFEWYEGNDDTMKNEADTLIGSNSDNNDLEISATIKFEQKLS